MPAGAVSIVLHSHLPWVLNHGRWPHGEEWLFEAAAECYIPLLNSIHALRSDGIRAGITLTFSPVLAEQLADRDFNDRFEEYLRDRRDRALADRRRFDESATDQAERELYGGAAFWADWYSERLSDFTTRYDRDLPAAFRLLQEDGAIDLQTCAATHGYLPLLGSDRSIDAQLTLARRVHTRVFGSAPTGCWMPECAYRPGGWWSPAVADGSAAGRYRHGLEDFFSAAGFDFTFVDAHTVTGSRSLGTWTGGRRLDRRGGDSRPPEASSLLHRVTEIADEVGSASGVCVLPRDVEIALQVWSGEGGYPGDPHYLEFHKRHHTSGHRYWGVTGRDVELHEKRRWNPARAYSRVRPHAEHWVSMIGERFRTDPAAEMVCLPFDTELFGHWWFEGPAFLEQVVRVIDADPALRTCFASEVVEQSSRRLAALPESSWGDGGDHRVWNQSSNSWSWSLLYEAEDLFLSRLDREIVSERQREVLRQAARELLVLQSSDWQFLISTGGAVDYAERRLRQHHRNVLDLVAYADMLADGDDPEEMRRRFQALSDQNRLFPDITLEDFTLHRQTEQV